MHQVYILKCSDGHPYVGCTNDLKNRIDRHSRGHVLATKNRLPIKLVFCASFGDKYIAFNFEKYLKSGSGRAFLNKHLI